jgi:hypothetical protein
MARLFALICVQRDEAAAVSELEDYALRDLLGWLGRLNVLSGIPGQIYGLCLLESSKRFQNS